MGGLSRGKLFFRNTKQKEENKTNPSLAGTVKKPHNRVTISLSPWGVGFSKQ